MDLPTVAEKIKITGHVKASYYRGSWSAEDIDAGLAGMPHQTEEAHNILVTAGITLWLNLLIGAGGTTYANANTYIGVGDSSTAAAIGQTDLQAATNKFKRVMDATFPTVASNVVTFRTTYATTEANFSLQEIGVFNGGPAFATGTMLNRAVSNLGTKTSASTLVLTVTITVS